MARVLIIDDRPCVRGQLAHPLSLAEFDVHETETVRDSLPLLRSSRFDVVLLGSEARGKSGDGDRLPQVVTEASGAPVLVFTCSANVADAVAAMKAGAHDYVQLPMEPDDVVRVVRGTVGERLDPQTPADSRGRILSHVPIERAIVADARTKQLFGTLRRIAEVDCTVLITGESGTGKEVVAWNIFKQSPRRNQRFVPINCGAIADTLAESELFGHHKGAFTGASSDKPGLLEEANGGVLFLDEIGEMSPRLQVMLLRFLDSTEMRRVGDTVVRYVNTRIIAATNRSLEQQVRTGAFRHDLFYRLCIISLFVPPLRDRPGDIPALAEHFLHTSASSLRKNVRAFSQDAMALLCQYSWPGNVRELRNCVERALVLATERIITPSCLPPVVAKASPSANVHGRSGGPPRSHSAGESVEVAAAIERFGGNQTRAAAALGVSRTTLWRKLRQARIGPNDSRIRRAAPTSDAVLFSAPVEPHQPACASDGDNRGRCEGACATGRTHTKTG